MVRKCSAATKTKRKTKKTRRRTPPLPQRADTRLCSPSSFHDHKQGQQPPQTPFHGCHRKNHNKLCQHRPTLRSSGYQPIHLRRRCTRSSNSSLITHRFVKTIFFTLRFITITTFICVCYFHQDANSTQSQSSDSNDSSDAKMMIQLNAEDGDNSN